MAQPELSLVKGPAGPKLKLLWISDSPRLKHIGQAIVTREILNRLCNVVDCWDICVMGYADERVKDPIDVPYRIKNALRSEMKDTDKLVEQIRKAFPGSVPDVIVFSHDIFLFPSVSEVKKYFPTTAFVGYITIDGVPIYSGWKEFFYAYDLVILPSEWARQELLDKWLDIETEVIPYGVNHDFFHPPKEGKENFKKLLQRSSHSVPGSKKLYVENCFVGIYAGANQSRKNLGAIYYGWKKFAEDKNDVRFYMLTHSALIDQYAGTYSLGSFLDANHFDVIPNEIQQEWLIRFFVAADVLVHPAMGEGFGLTIMEAMACGTVPMVCDYSSHVDFCNKRTSYIIKWTEYVGSYDVIRAVALHDAVTEQLRKAYRDWKNGSIEKKRKAAIKMASNYSWGKTAKMLHESLQRVIDRKRNVKGLVLSHIL